MSRFLRLFNTHTDYEAAVTAGEIELPNVAYCKDDKSVHFNPMMWYDLYDSDGNRLLDSEGYTLIAKQKQFL